MKLGARILKTGIAITLAIYAATLLQLSSPVFAGISAIFALQPTVYRSYKTLTNQFQANVIGAVLAIIFTLVFGNSPIVIGFTCIIMLSIALRFNMKDYVSIALVTIVAIMESSGDSFLYFALLRFATTFVGLISASLINLIFFPPKHEERLFQELEQQTKDMSSWIRISIHQAADYMAMKDEIDRHREALIKLRYFYLLYKEEYQTKLRKDSYTKARRLVLFRKMVAATDETFAILKLIHKFEHQLQHLPDDLQSCIKLNLENLITYHEQVLLRFAEKVKLDSNHYFTDEVQLGYEELLQHFTSFTKEDNDMEFVHLIQLFSSITTYKEKVETLDELIHSYHRFHQEKKEKKEKQKVQEVVK